MRPTLDRVIVKPTPPDKITGGGIHIPDTAVKKPTTGEVISTGPGRKDEPVDCTKGDIVVFNENAGMEFNYQKQDIRILRWSDILAVL